ncbi:MAG: glycosyltransferase family 39 protein, partial [Bacteroidetes bacterium]|nr:glycosyltransferase family 39 protein [Bacteroidota bacterium]
AILLVLLVAVLLRLGNISGSGHTLTSDELDYLQLAEQLRNGQTYATQDGPTAYRPPAYPFFVAGLLTLVSSLTFIFVIQILLELLVCILLYKIGTSIAGSSVGFTAMGVWALFPSSVIMPGLLMSETLFTAVLTGMMTMHISERRRPLLLGALLGISILLKPQMMLIGGVYGVRIVMQHRWKDAVMIAGMAGVLITPWIVRNAAMMDAAVLTTNGGINFWIGNNPEANGGYHVPSSPLLDSGATEKEVNNEGYRQGLSFILNEPAASVVLAGKKLAYLWSSQMYLLLTADDGINMERPYREQLREIPFRSALSVDIPYLLLVLFGLAGLFLLPEGKPVFTSAVIGLTVLWCIVHVLYFGAARFVYPILPMLAVTAAIGVQERHRIITLPMRSRLILSIIATLFLLLFVLQYVLIYR